MSHNQTAAQINHLLANIGGVIGDSINGFHYGQQSKCKARAEGAAFDLHFCVQQNFFFESLHRVVKEQHLARQFSVLALKRARGVAQHSKNAVGHHAKSVGRALLE